MPRRSRGAALVLLVALLGTACSGDPSPPADDGSPGTTRSGRKAKDGQAATCPTPPDAGGEEGEVALVDATADVGLVDPLVGMYVHATAVGDVQADGWADLFVGTFGDKQAERYRVRGATGPSPDRLLLGGPNGFRPSSGFPEASGRSSGAVFADLDADGDPDLVVARNGAGKSGAGEPTTVYANEGGRFTAKGSLPPAAGARAIGVLDYDGDNRLDLLITADRFSGRSSVLLRNAGGLAFEDRTRAAELPDVDGLGVATADFDGDGRIDLFVTDSNRLFLGRADATFIEAAGSTFDLQRYGDEDNAAGVAVGDLDRNGTPDLVVGQHFNSTISKGCRVPVRVYLNRSEGAGSVRFEDVTDAAGVPWFSTKAPHVEIADMDNDGWPDIVTSASASDGTRPAVLRNLGLRERVPVFATPPGLGHEQYWVTGGTLDVDHDGRLDLFLAEFEPDKPSKLFRSTAGSGHWLDVALPPDAGGVGALVQAYRPGTDKVLASAWTSLSAGYAGGAASAVHLGLGSITRVDLVVRTPDGREHRRAGVAADRRLRFPDDFGA